MSELKYIRDPHLEADIFIDLLHRSSLAERRPVNDRHCIENMLAHANLLITAWQQQTLVGVARSVTDFSYCCYLSDLAVDTAWQGRGVGRQLIRLTLEALGPQAKIILLSAPTAANFYAHLGFQHHQGAWTLRPADWNL